MNRREFFVTLGRLAAAGALGAIGAKIALKPPASAADATCTNEGWCAPCRLSATCGLPRALSFRRTRGAS